MLQRTIAHNEIIQNTNWVVGSECYVCDRWCYTLFVVATDKSSTLSGSYELLHSRSKHTKLIDIREYARRMVEASGNKDLDREHYMKMLPNDKRQELIENTDGQMDRLKKRFDSQDITLY